jgi:hypothetical protein
MNYIGPSPCDVTASKIDLAKVPDINGIACYALFIVDAYLQSTFADGSIIPDGFIIEILKLYPNDPNKAFDELLQRLERKPHHISIVSFWIRRRAKVSCLVFRLSMGIG